MNGPTAEVLAHWHRRAGVRRDPRRTVEALDIEAELRAGKQLFPLELMPHLDHPLVQRLRPERIQELASRHLYDYLSFTAHFETSVVNRATLRIALGEVDATLPTAARVDALKIYTDEGYHALYSFDLLAQLEAATGVPALPFDFGTYLARLDAVGSDLMPGQQGLTQMLQVVVFETLVTSILNVVPADSSVLSVVRETVADHARDEGRHHVYFSEFLQELWATLDRGQRQAAARSLPELIRRSLDRDLTPTAGALAVAGLTQGQIRTVLGDCYPPRWQAEQAAETARHSVRLFRDCGVLDVPGGLDAFAAAGLVDLEPIRAAG